MNAERFARDVYLWWVKTEVSEIAAKVREGSWSEDYLYDLDFAIWTLDRYVVLDRDDNVATCISDNEEFIEFFKGKHGTDTVLTREKNNIIYVKIDEESDEADYKIITI